MSEMGSPGTARRLTKAEAARQLAIIAAEIRLAVDASDEDCPTWADALIVVADGLDPSGFVDEAGGVYPVSIRDTATWTCPHGTTYTGSEGYVSGARSAHLEIDGWMQASRDGDRSTNDIAQEILAAAPQVETLIEEWFRVESRARVRLLEAQRGD